MIRIIYTNILLMLSALSTDTFQNTAIRGTQNLNEIFYSLIDFDHQVGQEVYF